MEDENIIAGEIQEESNEYPTMVRAEEGEVIQGSLSPYGKEVGTRNMSTILREILYARTKEGKQLAQDVMLALVREALQGDMNAQRLLLAYTDGLPTPMKEQGEVKAPLVVPSEIIAKYNLQRGNAND